MALVNEYDFITVSQCVACGMMHMSRVACKFDVHDCMAYRETKMQGHESMVLK